MYRKHLREMEQLQLQQQQQQQQQTYKTGYKTIDKISKLPVVNTAITQANDYYGKVKERNVLLRTSFSLAELSLNAIAYAATPITNICKKPIQNVDTYLSDGVDLLEYHFPVITKPADQLAATAYNHVKGIYDKTLKPPIDTIYNIKNSSVKMVTDMKTYGATKVNDVVQYGSNSLGSLRAYSYAQLVKSAGYGIRTADALLEQKYAKMLTTPILDLTERSINYLLPTAVANEIENHVDERDYLNETHTLRRIYDINRRVVQHTYQTTYTQIMKLNRQYNVILEKLNVLKQFATMSNATCMFNGSKDSLKAVCGRYVSLDNPTIAKLETLSKSYYRAILQDIDQMFNRYAEVLKNLPIVSQGTKLRQTTSDLLGRLLTNESLSELLKRTIEHLTTVHNSIMSFVYQVFPKDSRAGFSIIKRNNIEEVKNTNIEETKVDNNTTTIIKQQQQQQQNSHNNNSNNSTTTNNNNNNHTHNHSHSSNTTPTTTSNNMNRNQQPQNLSKVIINSVNNNFKSQPQQQQQHSNNKNKVQQVTSLAAKNNNNSKKQQQQQQQKKSTDNDDDDTSTKSISEATTTEDNKVSVNNTSADILTDIFNTTTASSTLSDD